MEEYKLKYTDRETAIEDLSKYEGESHIDGIVHVGKIPLTKAEFDNEGNEITPPTFKEGYHVDVYSEREDLVFNAERTYPENPYHKLSGK